MGHAGRSRCPYVPNREFNSPDGGQRLPIGTSMITWSLFCIPVWWIVIWLLVRI